MIDKEGYVLHLLVGVIITIVFRKSKAFQVALFVALAKELFDSYTGGATDILDVVFTVYPVCFYKKIKQQ